MSVRESGPPPYQIDAGLFQSVDRIVRHPRCKSVFGDTQIAPTGKGCGGDPNAEEMTGTGHGLDTFEEPFFGLAAANRAGSPGVLAVFHHSDGQAVAI
jgi:hypothetical protein